MRQAWLERAAAHVRAEASLQSVGQAEENLRMVREMYGAGLATHTQVLDAVTLLTAATSNRNDAALDEALAQLQLARAVGAL